MLDSSARMFILWHGSLQDRPWANWTNRSLLGTVLELSTLGSSSTHNTLQVLQRTTLGPASPKTGPGSPCQFSTIFGGHWFRPLFKSL